MLQGVHQILRFFPKNSRKFATSPSPALGCYWLFIALRALKVTYLDVGEGGAAVNCEKHNFS